MTQTSLYSRVLVKIGAERGELLSEAKIKALTENKDLQEFAAQLRGSRYQEQIGKLSLPLTSSKIENALYENLIEIYFKIIKNSPEEARKFLDLYLMNLEVENIKALMKATCAKLTVEEKTARIYHSVEKYFNNLDIIEEALKASSVEQVANILKETAYGSALKEGLDYYEQTGSTKFFDVFLDKLYYEELHTRYEELPKIEKPHAEFYARMESESFLLLTILRGKLLGYDVNWLRTAIPNVNFELSMDIVDEIVSAGDFESAFKIVLQTPYGVFFIRLQSTEETLAAAEKAFKKAILKHAKANIITEMFNIERPLGFLTQKKLEVQNLTTASLGVEAAMKPEDIQQQMLF